MSTASMQLPRLDRENFFPPPFPLKDWSFHDKILLSTKSLLFFSFFFFSFPLYEFPRENKIHAQKPIYPISLIEKNICSPFVNKRIIINFDFSLFFFFLCWNPRKSIVPQIPTNFIKALLRVTTFRIHCNCATLKSVVRARFGLLAT